MNIYVQWKWKDVGIHFNIKYKYDSHHHIMYARTANYRITEMSVKILTVAETQQMDTKYKFFP